MITISNLQKSFGARILFDSVKAQLNPGQRYGLVGANGSGKSTLLRILAGDDEPTSGKVSWGKDIRVGTLRQDQNLFDTDTIIHCAMRGNVGAFSALEKRETILNSDDESGLHSNLAEVEEDIARFDGYRLEAKTAEILEGLGLPSPEHHNALSTLSGGFKLRVLLAQVLVGNPEFLLLDEPTNHLDIVSIRWLEKFLTSFKGCLLVISHDQRFLDNVCTRILDIDYETLTEYAGNYSDFESQKAGEQKRRQAEIDAREREIAHKQAYVDRFRYKASKARQAQSRIKQISKIEVTSLPKSSRQFPKFAFQIIRKSGRQAFELTDIAKSFGEKSVLSHVNVKVMRGDKVAIIGPNGVGKSTLIKILAGSLRADMGKVDWGFETNRGYFEQSFHFSPEESKASAKNWLWSHCQSESESFVRGMLGRTLFSGDDSSKTLSQLSGGELARLNLARLMIQKPNVLLLDEVTNHLDVEAIEALVDALKSYEGTLIFVSHDRFFVRALASRVIELRPLSINDFPGGFDDYLADCGDDHLDAALAAKRAKKDSRAEFSQSSNKETYLSNKEKRKRAQKIESDLSKLMGKVERLEARADEIKSIFYNPDFYQKTKNSEISSLENEQRDIEKEISLAYDKLEQLESERESQKDP